MRSQIVGIAYSYQNRPADVYIRVRPNQLDYVKNLLRNFFPACYKVHYNVLNAAELQFASNFILVIK